MPTLDRYIKNQELFVMDEEGLWLFDEQLKELGAVSNTLFDLDRILTRDKGDFGDLVDLSSMTKEQQGDLWQTISTAWKRTAEALDQLFWLRQYTAGKVELGDDSGMYESTDRIEGLPDRESFVKEK